MKSKKIIKILFTLTLVFILFGCKENDSRIEKDSLKPMQYKYHDYILGETWNYQEKIPEFGEYNSSLVVMNTDTVYYGTPCYLLKFSGSIKDGPIDFYGEKQLRIHTNIEGTIFLSKKENNELSNELVFSYDITSRKKGRHLSIPIKMEIRKHYSYNGEDPKFLNIGDTWEVNCVTDEKTRIWANDSLIETADTSYAEKTESIFESIEETSVTDNSFKCLKIKKNTIDSKGEKIIETIILFSPEIKKEVVIEEKFFEKNNVSFDEKVKLLSFNNYSVSILKSLKNDNPTIPNNTIYLLLCFLSVFIFAFQLQGLLFDSFGDRLGYLFALVISAILYLALGFVLGRLIDDKVLFTFIVLLTCFLIPVFRIFKSKSDSKSLLKALDESNSKINDENFTQDNSRNVELLNVDFQTNDTIVNIGIESNPLINSEQLVDEIKSEIGVGSFNRWYELTIKMLYESNKSMSQVKEELISYGLKKETAEKLLKLFIK